MCVHFKPGGENFLCKREGVLVENPEKDNIKIPKILLPKIYTSVVSKQIKKYWKMLCIEYDSSVKCKFNAINCQPYT